LGIFTPVRSGPNCASGCLTYPYLDAAAFVPRDYLWIYAALLMVLAFVVLVAGIHHRAPDHRKIFSQIGLVFAGIAAAVLAVDYAIQLAVLQPSLLDGETDGLAPFVMYNPHGVFLALEDVGYLLMSVAFLSIGTVFVQHTRLDRSLRWLFTISALAGIAALIGLSLVYGKDLQDHFEVVIITINWTVLIVAGVLLSQWFRRSGELDAIIVGQPLTRNSVCRSTCPDATSPWTSTIG
jgi:hypothetical protein